MIGDCEFPVFIELESMISVPCEREMIPPKGDTVENDLPRCLRCRKLQEEGSGRMSVGSFNFGAVLTNKPETRSIILIGIPTTRNDEFTCRGEKMGKVKIYS